MNTHTDKRMVAFSERERVALHKMLDTNLMISMSTHDTKIHHLEMLLINYDRVEKKQMYHERLRCYQNLKHIHKLIMKSHRELESVSKIMRKILNPGEDKIS